MKEYDLRRRRMCGCATMCSLVSCTCCALVPNHKSMDILTLILRSTTWHPNFSRYFMPHFLPQLTCFGFSSRKKKVRNFRPSLSPPPGPTKNWRKTKAWVRDQSARCRHSSKTPTCTRYPVGQKPKLDRHSPWVPPRQCCLLNQAFFQFNSRCHQASSSKAHSKRW